MTDDCFPWEVTANLFEIYTRTGERAFVCAITPEEAIDRFISYYRDQGVHYDKEELTAYRRNMLL